MEAGTDTAPRELLAAGVLRVLGATAIAREWIAAGACHATPHPEWWYPAQGDPARDAHATCDACPVRLDCLDYAMHEHITDGIWGGLSARARERERKALGERLAVCRWCERRMVVELRRGGVPAYCSPECHDHAKAAQEAAYARSVVEERACRRTA